MRAIRKKKSEILSEIQRERGFTGFLGTANMMGESMAS